MRMLSLLLALSFALVSCADKTPSEAFLIPKNQLASVVNAGNGGDLGAVKRLISHYEATPGNDAIAEEWRTKARLLGDAQELYYYAARLFTGAKGEPDPAKKRKMLVEAFNSAKRSYSSRADGSTQQLIDEISRSLQSM